LIQSPAATLRRFPEHATRHSWFGLLVRSKDRDGESREERNIGLKGSLLWSTFIMAILGIYPAAAVSSPTPATSVTWHRDGLVTWDRVEDRAIARQTVYRLTLKAGSGSKVIAAGSAGVLEVRMRYFQRDGGMVRRCVLVSRVIREAKPRIVAEPIGAMPLSLFEARGIAAMAHMARSAMQMLATAYTADCAGCDGMTELGRRAGHGIVAVDPRVIPIGTRLYITGYGLAVAGDTGGDIVGRRIDLGFDSERDAMLFGRRAVTVYQLK
jgi:3D (Asp-Asp-Asp) domain-containing protein